MTLINHVPALVAQKFEDGKINYTVVQQATQLNYATVRKWLIGPVNRFDPVAIEAWCKYLGVGVGDIIEYVPDEKAG